MSSSDIMVQLNGLQAAQEVAKTPFGAAYLANNKGIDMILDSISPDDGMAHDGFGVIVRSAMLEVLGVAFSHDFQDTQLPDFHDTFDAVTPLLWMLSHGNDFEYMSDRIDALNAVRLMAKSSAGRHSIMQQRGSAEGKHKQTVLTHVIRMSRGGSVGGNRELQTAALHTLAFILETSEPENKDMESTQIQEWIEAEVAGDILVKECLEMLEMPLQELRYAVYHCLQELAGHCFGVSWMADTYGLVEYLLKRSTEEDNQGRDWKFGIMEAMVNTHRNKEPVPKFAMNSGQGPIQLAGIVEYLRLGRYYQGSETAVLVETEGM
eukprot:TRINITY_DN1183_c1_g1_i5.p1 TRINITY_DN1183_c1_g1~~TRINITY_DN1183_c1_g1_i5.p1  ORF type:complete len:364 (+),score=87.36 TRINITY_DN1183_c1_g1_i5:132-1094(+)